MIFEIVERRAGVAGFAQERRAAEERSRAGVPETTIERIYEQLPYPSTVRQELMQLELQAETTLASAIAENVAKLAPDDVVLSDMYLGADVLARIARHCDVPLNAGRLLVSGDLMLTKHSGELFQEALRRFHISEHCGDNPHGDVAVPRSVGLEATHFRACELTAEERAWAQSAGDGREYAGLLRAARLACSATAPRQAEWNIYAQIVAPVLVQFVEWLLANALQRSIRRVYFLSRDGQILHAIASRIVAARGMDIDCRYLYASRQALHLPGHVSMEQSLGWLMDDTEVLSLETLADRGALAIDDVARIASPLEVDVHQNLTRDQRRRLMELLNSSTFAAMLQSSASRARASAMEYFRLQGLHGDGQQTVAIVDVGWNARLQRSLENILSLSGGPCPTVHGYYLALSDGVVYADGSRVHGFIADPFEPSRRPGRWIDRYRGMIEFFLAADHPSVHGYRVDPDGTARPTFGAASCGDSEDVLFRQQAILAFADRYSALSRLLARPLQDPSGFSLRRLEELLNTPTRFQASAFRNFQVTEQQVEAHFVPLVRQLSLAQVFSRPRTRTHGVWTEGSHAISGSLYWYQIPRRTAGGVWRALKRSLAR